MASWRCAHAPSLIHLPTHSPCPSFDILLTSPAQIVSAFNLAAVANLKKTWKGVPQRDLDALAELQKLMDHLDNYKSYREEILAREKVRRAKIPCRTKGKGNIQKRKTPRSFPLLTDIVRKVDRCYPTRG
jgi:hypothetical protein